MPSDIRQEPAQDHVPERRRTGKVCLDYFGFWSGDMFWS